MLGGRDPRLSGFDALGSWREWLGDRRRSFGLTSRGRHLGLEVNRFGRWLWLCRRAGGRRLGNLFGLGGTNEALALGLPAYAVSLSVFDRGGVALYANAEFDAEVQCLFVRQAELACELVDADLLRQRSSNPFPELSPGQMATEPECLSSHTLRTGIPDTQALSELFDGLSGNCRLEPSFEGPTRPRL
jgi:hypothetical protein